MIQKQRIQPLQDSSMWSYESYTRVTILIRRDVAHRGPKISTQDQAMRVLGIGTEETKDGNKKVS